MEGNDKTLVVGEKSGILEKDKTVTDLMPGQLGVFDYETGKSVDSNIDVNQYPEGKFYFAVGLDLDGDGMLDNIMTSAGEYHILKNSEVFKQAFRVGVPMKVIYKDYLGKSNSEYGLKVLIKSGDIGLYNGHSNKYEDFTYVTECKDCSGECYDVDANKITLGLKKVINTSENMSAVAVARQDVTAQTHGTSQDYSKGQTMSDSDVEALIAYNETQTDQNAKVYTDLVITSNIKKPTAFQNIPYNYSEGWTTIQVSKFGDDICTGQVEVIQEPTIVRGDGNQVRMMEYFSFGNVDIPYRQRVLGPDLEILLNARKDGQYDVVTIREKRKTVGSGSGVFENVFTTHIAFDVQGKQANNSYTQFLDLISKYTDIVEA